MSCCGRTRLAQNPENPAFASASRIGAAGQSASAPFAGPVLRAAQFEYLGGRMLIVIGQGTGNQYRFVGYGARLSVDPRDRASLAVVPGLRELQR